MVRRSLKILVIDSQKEDNRGKKELDIWYCRCYHRGMKEKHRWPTTSIRANPEVLHQARVSAVTQKKTLGQWLEEAIMEKIRKEHKLSEEGRVTNESSVIRQS